MKNSFQNLNKAFDNKIRLGIMSVLSVNAKVTFNDLKEMLELKSLESAGYITVIKTFKDRKPNTRYEITLSGAEAFDSHLKTLEEILKHL